MTDITDRLRAMSQRVDDQAEHIRTEEGTKQALIVPFMQTVLGFDTTNVQEVRPEFTADIGTKKGEKVDYAIIIDGKPLILIEAKKVGVVLEAEQPNQLLRYFNAVNTARFGIYTNGIHYLFYSDLEQPNVMDQRPFFELDLTDTIDPLKINEIRKFTKAEFDSDSIRASANRLKYTQAIKNELEREMSAPSEDLAKLFMGRVYPGARTARRVEEFIEYISAAWNQLIADAVREKLTAALARTNGTIEEQPPQDHAEESEEDGIVTTEDELIAYYIVKAIVHGVVEQSRVTLRDQKTVCLILLDDNRLKWITRLYFNGNRYRLGLRDDDDQEKRIDIDSPNDIYDFADDIRNSAGRLV